MSQGVLIFAFNNSDVDYLAMAAWSADRIRRHLNLPVAVVTDGLVVPDKFDVVIPAQPIGNNQRLFNDLGKQLAWHNGNRVDAYNLTPWDQTLVLDADYVVCSNQLRVLFDLDQDFLAHRYAVDLTCEQEDPGLNYFGDYRMPMWWATVLYFTKSQQAKMIFDMMSMIRQHWNHYRDLFKNARKEYRNDHALSIAINTVNGHCAYTGDIPWQLPTLTVGNHIQQLGSDHFRVEFKSLDKKPKYIELNNMDFHILGKQQLGAVIANNQ